MPTLAFRSLLLASALLACASQAAVITSQSTQVNGTTWRYDYTLSNNGAITSEIYLFDILFDPALYEEASLTIVSATGISSGWDELILASGTGVPAAYDVLATGGGIGQGESVAGFAVSFIWLGTGTPGQQGFEIYDPVTFQLLGSGTTAAVPAPATLWLLGTGLLAAALRSARRTRSRPHRTAAPASSGDS